MTNTKRDKNRPESRHGERLAVSVRGYDDAGGIGARALGTLRNLDGFPPTWEVDFPLEQDPSAALAGLEEARHWLRHHQAVTIGAVAAARSAGMSWQKIADALEIPKQTCMDRYSAYVGLL